MEAPRAIVGGRRRGLVLLSVSWCILILALLLASRLAREEICFVEERGAQSEQSLRLAVRSAEALVLGGLAADASAETKERRDAFSDVWSWRRVKEQIKEDLGKTWPDVTLEVAIEDEQSKINPGKASAATVRSLLAALGCPESQAGELAQAILTAVENAKNSGSESPEDDDRASSFLDLRCLLSVPGLSKALFVDEDMNFNGKLDPNENDADASSPDDDRDGALRKGLLRYFSPWGDGKVNPNLASAELLRTIPGVSKKMASEIVNRRTGGDGVEGTDDDMVFARNGDMMKLGSVSKFAELELRKMTPYLRMDTDVYQIRICATSKRTGQMLRRQAVVRRQKSEVRVISQLEDNGL